MIWFIYYNFWYCYLFHLDWIILYSKEINTYILERTWHKDQECKQNDDGSVYLSFTSNQTQELKYWIMSFGSAVKVLSPETLREDIKKELLKSIENF